MPLPVSGTKAFGGYGQAAFGRCQLGTSSSDITPKFYTSSPSDGAQRVALDRWIEFYTYYYSSVPAALGPDPETPFIEISENGGATYLDASLAPYALTYTAVDGQRYWCKILKTIGQWPENSEIIIRYTGVDEHGNAAEKTVPVVCS